MKLTQISQDFTDFHEEVKAKNWIIFCDNAITGHTDNRGKGIISSGFVIFDKNGDKKHHEVVVNEGRTNNFGEYLAIKMALEYVKENDLKNVLVFSDSKIAVDQIIGRLNCNTPILVGINNDVKNLLKETETTIKWIPREKNKIADNLVKKRLENYRNERLKEVRQDEKMKDWHLKLCQDSGGRLQMQMFSNSEKWKKPNSRLISCSWEHRLVLNNELVFDIDAETWPKCYRQAVLLEDKLENKNIPFIRATTGNRLHYHVFMKPDILIPNYFWEEYEEVKDKYLQAISNSNNGWIYLNQIKFINKVKMAIFKHIIEDIELGNDYFDREPVKSNRHMIRAFGSNHEKTGFYKSVIDNLPTEKPKITEEKITYPSGMEYWNISDSIFYEVYNEFKNLIRKWKPSKKGKNLKSGDVLNTILCDGRKRAVFKVILPLLITKEGMDRQEAFERTMEWLNKNYSEERSDNPEPMYKMQNWVQSVSRWAKNSNIYPSFKKWKELKKKFEVKKT